MNGPFKYSFNLTEADSRNEREIVRVFLNHIGSDRFYAEKIEEAVAHRLCGQKIDFKIIDRENSKFVGFAECKRRNLTLAILKRYGGLFLSKKKYVHMREKATIGRCVYVAGLNDVVGYQSINDDEIVREYWGGGGATNRNSKNDIELMVVFNPEQFKVIAERG